MKVLIPIDGSSCCQKALEHIAEQSWWGDTTFMVLHVISQEDANDHPEYGFCCDSKTAEVETTAAQKLLKEKTDYLTKMLGAKMRIESNVLRGYPADTIIAAAVEWNADLIIIGSHGYKGLKKLFLGSVTEKVLSNAPCSVEVVKNKECANSPKPELFAATFKENR